MRYYLDTCIWMDFLNERDDAVSKKVFDIVLNQDIIISEKILLELGKYVEQVNLLNFKRIYLAEVSEIQRKYALKIARERNLPFGDALHAIVAKDNGAILITRDKHFLKLKDVAIIELL